MLLAVPNPLLKVKCWSCSCLLWHPRRLGCDCLSNSCRPVVFNPSSEGHTFDSQAPFVWPSEVFHKNIWYIL